MKQKLFTSVACLVLLMLMLLGSTLAWLTDRSDSVNTMVAGKIGIRQTQTDGDLTQVLMPSQEYKKTVTVTNTGTQPCFVRTLFAFEDNTYGGKSVVDMISTDNSNIVFPKDENGKKIQFKVIKDGKETTFTIGCYVHEAVLEVGRSVTPLNLVKLSEQADNDWIAAVNDCYELIILSQACQSNGMEHGAEVSLNTAFDAITGENCALWFVDIFNDSDLYTPGNLSATVSGNTITIAS